MLTMWQALGYRVRCVVPRVGEDCYLLTNRDGQEP
jgi:hypothetical protein